MRQRRPLPIPSYSALRPSAQKFVFLTSSHHSLPTALISASGWGLGCSVGGAVRLPCQHCLLSGCCNMLYDIFVTPSTSAGTTVPVIRIVLSV